MDVTELELFKLRLRLALVEEMAVKSFVVTISSSTDVTLEKSREIAIAWLEKTAKLAEQTYLSTMSGADGALAADEAREIVESMKKSLMKLPVSKKF